jgi:hypothetical protein
LWRPFAFLFNMGKTADEPGAASAKRRKSYIYRRGVSVPTTAKVRLGEDDVRD